MNRGQKWLLYLASFFPLFGFIIGALNYKSDRPFARNCLGIAIFSIIVYLTLQRLR